MNKGRRNELRQLKYKRRLKMRGLLNNKTLTSPKGDIFNFACFKESSTPCSCSMCSHNKYSRSKQKAIDKVILSSDND